MEIFPRIRSRFGDFWWYSLMIFCASRVGDALNAVVGLYVVPKFVKPDELGAVLPLSSFATLLALPATAFAMVFMKELTALATRGELGRMKSLMRGVFVVTAVTLVLATVLSRAFLPLFFERVRVEEGSLLVLIVGAGFMSCVAPVYSNALQALKKFRTLSLVNIAGAPVRLAVLLLAMPFRALSGYFVGQAATPAFTIAASVVSLRRELAVRAEPYWDRRVFARFFRMFLGVGAAIGAWQLTALVSQTVIRQRLPALDSAAFYLVSRFSDVAMFLSTALLVTMFPYVAELTEKGESARAILRKSTLAMLGFGLALTGLFAVVSRPLLAVLPFGEHYVNYAWAIPWMVVITTLTAIQNFYVNARIAQGRFGFLRWYLPFNLLFAAALLCVSGHGYFERVLPEGAYALLKSLEIGRLDVMLAWLGVQASVNFLGLLRTAMR